MNFFGVGPGEVLLILLVALILVGPRRLPETAAHIGRTVRGIRRYAAAVTSQVKEELADLEAEYEATKEEAQTASRILREVSTEVEGEARALEGDVDEATGEVRRALAQEAVDSTPTAPEEGTEGERPTNVVSLEKYNPTHPSQ